MKKGTKVVDQDYQKKWVIFCNSVCFAYKSTVLDYCFENEYGFKTHTSEENIERLATTEEVEKHLSEIAIKKGYRNSYFNGEIIPEDANFNYTPFTNTLDVRCESGKVVSVFKDNKWIGIIETDKVKTFIIK